MRKCFIISIILFTLALVATAEAGNGSLCRDLSAAQSSSGVLFSSKRECQKASEVFSPTAAIDPGHVGAGELFYLTVTGFHPDASSTVYFAITGQDPYASYEPFYPTDADGNFSIPFRFAECRKTDTGLDVSVDLTLTFVDSFGVHASATMTLC